MNIAKLKELCKTNNISINEMIMETFFDERNKIITLFDDHNHYEITYMEIENRAWVGTGTHIQAMDKITKCFEFVDLTLSLESC